jgi:uncharacterized secreted protein with C-terminal beta-propeller domain
MTGSSVLRRIVATVTALVAMTGAFAAGFLVAGARSGEPPAYRLSAAGLDSGLSCDRLRQWYVDHALDRVTAWGWQAPIYAEGVPMEGDAVAGPAAAPNASSPERSLDTDTTSGTGTNVQEADVDEPDLAKVSGDLLVRIDHGTLKTDDVSGSTPTRLGVAPLDRMGDPQLLLSGDRAVVIGSDIESRTTGSPVVLPAPRTWVRTYDLSDPADPRLVDARLYDGSLVAARQLGSTVRLVLDGGLPSLDFTQPSTTVSQTQALDHNRELVRDSTAADWLPRVTAYVEDSGSARQLLDCSEVSVPETFNGLGTLSIVGFDPADPDVTDSSAVATGSDSAYMSSSHLYVAMSPWSHLAQGWGPVLEDGDELTRIYAFDLSGTATRYAGMGTVDGGVAGSWSMDEHDGVLRVAVSSLGSTSTSLVMLRPQAGRLLDIGHLGGLGEGQQLKSVRWFDDLAVLVTFQQVDPFYVVDVADPADPRVLGELHLPGWSSYLHPVGPHLVLGLGQTSPREMMVEPPIPLPTKRLLPPPSIPPTPIPESPEGPEDSSGTGGDLAPGGAASDPTVSTGPIDPPNLPFPVIRQHAKATLFDISDLTSPRDVDTVAYPQGSMPMAALDPHQVTWLPDRQVLLTVVTANQSLSSVTPDATLPQPRAWVSVLTVGDRSLDNRMVPVAEATDAPAIRTLPLADGRVVIVAGDSVRFLTV